MRRSEQLESSITKLEQQLKQQKRELTKAKRLEKKQQEKEEYDKKVEEALKFIDVTKSMSVTIYGRQMTIYDYVIQRLQTGKGG